MPSTPATAAGVGDIATQAARRRTFAIVSHPDAGKTTTTEKLLLYAGALDRAGSVIAALVGVAILAPGGRHASRAQDR